MTHRGPFQPLLFCDSVILWKHKVSTSALEFAPPSPPRATRRQGLHGLSDTDSCSGIGCQQRKEILKTLPPIQCHQRCKYYCTCGNRTKENLKKMLESESEIQPCTNPSLWSSQEFSPGLWADLKQVSGSWQLKAGPHPAAKQIPLKPRYFTSY